MSQKTAKKRAWRDFMARGLFLFALVGMAAGIHRSTILNRNDAKIKMHKMLLNSFEGVSVSSSSLPLGEGDKSGCS
jgi:hypothetical protein